MNLEEKIREKLDQIQAASTQFRSGYECGIRAGVNLGIKEAFRWRDVNDRSEPMPKGDCLIKTETGKIFRYNEDWEDEREIITHWRPMNQKDL